jgi:hypothetical protein
MDARQIGAFAREATRIAACRPDQLAIGDVFAGGEVTV